MLTVRVTWTLFLLSSIVVTLLVNIQFIRDKTSSLRDNEGKMAQEAPLQQEESQNESSNSSHSSSRCEIHYGNPSGLKVALASLPGSGNTWVRHLIQLSTGYLTGSTYTDEELKKNGFPAEGITDPLKVIAVKEHAPIE